MHLRLIGIVVSVLLLLAVAADARQAPAPTPAGPAAPSVQLETLTGVLEAPPAVPEALRLQVELVVARDEAIRLKTVILNLQLGQLEQERARVVAERVLVEQRLRAVLQPPAGHVYDWQRQQFVAKPEGPR